MPTIKVKEEQNKLRLVTFSDSGVLGGAVVPTTLIKLLDEDGPLTYVGEALPGTLTSEAKWRIFRLDETGAGAEELIKLFMNGSTAFDQVWDDRTTEPFS